MADIENWLISGTSCCASTKHPWEIELQKVETIFEHVSGDISWSDSFVYHVPRALLARLFEAVPTNTPQSSCACTRKNVMFYL